VPAERLFACRSLPSLLTGLRVKSACCPARGKDSRCQSSASNSESAGYPPKLIAGICLGVRRPDWPSAIGRNPGFAPHTSPTWPVPPIDKPRCTYYLGACLEQGNETKARPPPGRDLAPQPPVLPSIASKHLETLVTGAFETLVGSYWLSSPGRHFLGNPGHILGHTDLGVDSSSIPAIG
jgi:hypothetical protein